ncbi:hypothetical protein ABW21_db0205519 [Orbilia brochopaga]|nr:hypothetical protein ABW21_db0205519 [Drechslerella brochopaga]
MFVQIGEFQHLLCILINNCLRKFLLEIRQNELTHLLDLISCFFVFEINNMERKNLFTSGMVTSKATDMIAFLVERERSSTDEVIDWIQGETARLRAGTLSERFFIAYATNWAERYVDLNWWSLFI